MTRPNERRRAPRGTLTADRVVAAAMHIADTEGIAAVTMRSVAAALGVQAMSLYNHVATKDAILDRLVDAVFETVDVDPTLPWRAFVRARACALRAALLRHPWAIGLLESRRAPGATTLRHHDTWIGVLRGAGLSPRDIAHALAVVDAFVYGFALQEVSMPVGPAETLPDLAGEILGSMPEGALPHLAWFTAEHVMKPGYAYASEFEFGLDLVLDGLEATHPTGGSHV